MPKFVVIPKVDNLFGKEPEGVTRDQLLAGEFDTLEQASDVASAALQFFPGQSRTVAEVKAVLTAQVTVQVEAAAEVKAK